MCKLGDALISFFLFFFLGGCCQRELGTLKNEGEIQLYLEKNYICVELKITVSVLNHMPLDQNSLSKALKIKVHENV